VFSYFITLTKLRVRIEIFPGMLHPKLVNAKLARDAIGRSALWLKGKPCNGGNSENYINARNRKVYTMIELHGVGLLAEGQSAFTLRILFVNYASRAAVYEPAIFFLAFCRNDRIFWRALFSDGLHWVREKNHLEHFSAKVCCRFRHWREVRVTQVKQISGGFQFQRCTQKKDDRRVYFFR